MNNLGENFLKMNFSRFYWHNKRYVFRNTLFYQQWFSKRWTSHHKIKIAWIKKLWHDQLDHQLLDIHRQAPVTTKLKMHRDIRWDFLIRLKFNKQVKLAIAEVCNYTICVLYYMWIHTCRPKWHASRSNQYKEGCRFHWSPPVLGISESDKLKYIGSLV